MSKKGFLTKLYLFLKLYTMNLFEIYYYITMYCFITYTVYFVMIWFTVLKMIFVSKFLHQGPIKKKTITPFLDLSSKSSENLYVWSEFEETWKLNTGTLKLCITKFKKTYALLKIETFRLFLRKLFSSGFIWKDILK